MNLPDGGTIPVDCGKLALCGPGQPCTCTATSCTVSLGSGGDIQFDMQLAGDTLNGSVTGLAMNQTFNVHLSRSP